MNLAKRYIVLPTILLLVLSFIVVCAQPPPDTTSLERSMASLEEQMEALTNTIDDGIDVKNVSITFMTPTPQAPPAEPTAAPTLSPTPVPTAILIPTPTPTPTSQLEHSSWGVSRSALREFYEDTLDFECISGVDIRGFGEGSVTWKCYSPIASALNIDVEIIGPLGSDEVIDTRMIVYNPHLDGDLAAAQTALFLRNAAPQWTGAFEWVDGNLLDATDGKIRSFAHGNNRLTMQWISGSPAEFVLHIR